METLLALELGIDSMAQRVQGKKTMGTWAQEHKTE